jgi:hypothetical protein
VPFEREIERVALVDRDDQWHKKLTAAQQVVLQRTRERAKVMPIWQARNE